MDPVSAFGLAASVVQFITFATTLIHKTVEIYGSGSSEETRNLEVTYQTLSQFNNSLSSSSNVNDLDPILRRQVQAIRNISDSCQDDCEKLLKVVSKLKAATDAKRRLLKTFRAAWATFMKGDEIASFERRLARSQATLTFCICQMSNYYLGIYREEVSVLTREANKRHLRQDEQLTELETKIDEFKLFIEEKTSTQTLGFSASEVEVLNERLSTFEVLKKDIERDHKFLDSLRFRRQPERYRSIPKAHTQTFSWILDPPSTGTEVSKLRKWLEQPEGGIFWISGKPGSGKSTLMKFIADNERTPEILSNWVGGKKLVIASHYFWWSGTALQKSQEGLLRTLLYSILRQCPDLIRKICNDRWAARPIAADFKGAEINDSAYWTLEELRSAFSAIAHYPDVPVRFCFFIDGLDEYEGDHKEICDIFLELAEMSSVIKICLSSRPWNVFEQALGMEARRIYIHDLTQEDITKFAQSRLYQHHQWQIISADNPAVEGLVNEITGRAQGVFLWVFLVTGLLCEGLNNGDSFSDLKLRLETFPVDLERFFKDILERVDSFYHAKVSAVLQTALTAEEPLNISLYAFQEEEFEDSNYAVTKKVGVLSNEAVQKRQRVMAQRLNGWSKGLVEVRNQEVHFLHRTVVDFLKTREMKDFIAQKLPPWFCTSLSLLKAHLAWIKTSNFAHAFAALRPILPTTLELRVGEALGWAFEIDVTLSPSSPVQNTASLVLDDMERSIGILFASDDVSSQDERKTKQMQCFFRESVLRKHLAGYLSRKLMVSPDYFHDFDKPALSVLLEDYDKIYFGGESNTAWTKEWTDTLRCLLEAGHDPNQKYNYNDQDCTPWTRFLSTVISWDELGECAAEGDEFVGAMRSRLFSLFLDHGADPHAVVFRTGQAFPEFSRAWVDMLLMSFEISATLADEDAYLQELDAFFQRRVKVDATSKATIISNELVDHGALAYEAFLSQLPQRIKSGRCNASLLERVTEILLRKLQDSGIGLDWALGKVKTALAPTRYQQLRSALELRGKSIAVGSKKRKKRRGVRTSGGVSKRQRTST